MPKIDALDKLITIGVLKTEASLKRIEYRIP